MHHFRKRKRPTPCPGDASCGHHRRRLGRSAPATGAFGSWLPPSPGPYLAVLVDAFLSVFFSLSLPCSDCTFRRTCPLCARSRNTCACTLCLRRQPFHNKSASSRVYRRPDRASQQRAQASEHNQSLYQLHNLQRFATAKPPPWPEMARATVCDCIYDSDASGRLGIHGEQGVFASSWCSGGAPVSKPASSAWWFADTLQPEDTLSRFGNQRSATTGPLRKVVDSACWPFRRWLGWLGWSGPGLCLFLCKQTRKSATTRRSKAT